MMNGYELDWAALAVIVGAVLPILISLVKQNQWSQRAKQWTATLVSVVAAIVTTWVEVGGLGDLNVLLLNLGLIITTSQATYAQFWNDSTIEVAAANVRSDVPKAA